MTMPSAQEHLLSIVEAIEEKHPKLRKQQSFELASVHWRKTYGFDPPYISFDGFRRYRNSRQKKVLR